MPIIQFSADNLEGCAPMSVNLSNLSDTGPVSCLWTINNGYSEENCNGISTILEYAGCYDINLQLTTSIGCTDNIWYNNYICVQDYPEANFLPSQSVMTLIDTYVEFTNLSMGAETYFWNLGDGQVTSTDFEVHHTYPNEDAGYYEIELIASTSFGCEDSITLGVEVLDELIVYVPNTFTPDNDNYNEYWKPVFDTGYDPQSLDLFIFNRWGEIIWESHNVDAGWDGTYGSSREPVRDGTYLWKMEFSERSSDKRHLFTGHVNILK